MPFALSPYVATSSVIDYSTDRGQRHYDAATAPLGKGETKKLGYELTPQDSFALLITLATRATKMGWSAKGGILWVNDAEGNARNILNEYGVLTLDEITQVEETNLTSETRNAQDSHMLYHCLLNSMSPKATTTIGLKKADCCIEFEDEPEPVQSGLLLLRYILREAQMESTASLLALRERITNLHLTFKGFQCDVQKFNLYVKKIQQDLTSCGKTSPELLDHLFRAYLLATDNSFVDYIQQKLDAHQEGVHTTPSILMQGAENKYHAQKETGVWDSKTPKQEKLVMLEAKLAELQKDKKSGGRHRNNRFKPNDSRNGEYSNKPAWLLWTQTPKDPTAIQTWNGRKYNWCGTATGGNVKDT